MKIYYEGKEYFVDEKEGNPRHMNKWETIFKDEPELLRECTDIVEKYNQVGRHDIGARFFNTVCYQLIRHHKGAINEVMRAYNYYAEVLLNEKNDNN